MPKRFLPVAAALLCAVSICGAGTAPPSPRDSSEAFPAHIVRFYSSIPLSSPSDLFSPEGQRFMQALPAVGREDMHLAQEDWPIRASRCAAAEPSLEAIDHIVANAGEARVVMINEAHDRPRHRDFIRRLAIELRPLGFAVFAAETFSDTISSRPQTPFPSITDGFYSGEPVFGGLLREVIALGYRLEPYEHRFDEDDLKLGTHSRAQIREQGQARNLQRIIASMGEGERLLVHAGYSHPSEVPIPSFEGKDLLWMAGQFRSLTGIDPLTIDQTDCSVGAETAMVTVPSSRHVPGQFDIVIGQPDLTFEDQRPAWRQVGAVHRVAIPESFRADAERVIVEARPAIEPEHSVPVDRVMLWPGEDLPLLLPQGKYAITAYFEESGRTLRRTAAVGEH